MARTRAEIEAAFRASDPVMRVTEDGVERVLSVPEYEARLAEWVETKLAAELAADAEAARKELRRQVRAARTRLQAIRDTTSFSNASRDAALRDLTRVLDGLIGVLIDRALIEATDE